MLFSTYAINLHSKYKSNVFYRFKSVKIFTFNFAKKIEKFPPYFHKSEYIIFRFTRLGKTDIFYSLAKKKKLICKSSEVFNLETFLWSKKLSRIILLFSNLKTLTIAQKLMKLKSRKEKKLKMTTNCNRSMEIDCHTHKQSLCIHWNYFFLLFQDYYKKQRRKNYFKHILSKKGFLFFKKL